MNNKLTPIILGATVAIIVVASVLVPIITDASEDQHTIFNNSIGQYSSIVGDDVTINFTYDSTLGTYTYSANGESVQLVPGQDPILVTDKILFKMGVTSSPSNYLATYLDQSAIVFNVSSLNAIISNGIANLEYTTATNVTQSMNIPYEWGFYATAIGEFRAVWGNETIFFQDTDDVYGAIWNSTGVDFISYHGKTSFADGFVGTVDYNESLVNGVVDVYYSTLSETSGKVQIFYNDGETDVTVRPITAIVPAEIVGDKTKASDAFDGVLWTIPLMVIVSILVAVVTVLIRRN